MNHSDCSIAVTTFFLAALFFAWHAGVYFYKYKTLIQAACRYDHYVYGAYGLDSDCSLAHFLYFEREEMDGWRSRLASYVLKDCTDVFQGLGYFAVPEWSDDL